MNRHTFLSALGGAASLLGFYLLYRVIRRYDMGEVMGALGAVPASTIILALGCTVVAFLFLIGAEYLAVRYTRQPVSFGRVARTAVAALGIGHSLGLAALSSGAVRYRMYSRAGLNLPAVGRVVLFSGVTVALGLGLVGSGALLWRSEELARLTGATPGALQAVAAAALILIAGYLLVCAFGAERFKIRHFHLDVPSFRVACCQMFFGSGYLLSVAGVLYASLRSFTEADYGTVAALYVGADISALVGHVPGGWGLIEYIVTSALEGPHLLAGLIVFRATYYLLPLAVGIGIFVADEVSGGRRRRQRKTHPVVAAHPSLRESGH